MNLELIGGRRFVLTMVSGAGTWLLCWCGKIDGGVYSVVTIATVAAYITGNVAQRIGAPEPKPDTTPTNNPTP